MMPCGAAWQIFAAACIHKKLQYIRSISRRNFCEASYVGIDRRGKVFISFLTELNTFRRLGYRNDAPTEPGKRNKGHLLISVYSFPLRGEVRGEYLLGASKNYLLLQNTPKQVQKTKINRDTTSFALCSTQYTTSVIRPT